MALSSEFFWDLQHAMSYLTGCIIRTTEGEPIVVLECFAPRDERDDQAARQPKFGGITAAHLIMDGATIWVDKDRLDLSPVPLGFINITNAGGRPRVVYTSRLPARIWKVGLTNHSIILTAPYPDAWQPAIGAVWKRSCMADTIRGHFPSLQACQKAIRKDTRNDMLAFSRRFALRSGNKLYYKTLGEPVGVLRAGVPDLFEDYQYLKEVLEEDQNGRQ